MAESQDNGADGGEGGPLKEEHGDDLYYKMVVVVATCKTDMVVISTTKLWWPLAGRTWRRSPLQDGGSGGSLRDRHSGDHKYVYIQDGVAPCKTDMVVISSTRWWWWWWPLAGQT